MVKGPWNWLEVAKLAVGILTPIIVAIFGLLIHRITKRFENLQWRSQKLIEKRLSIYDDLAPNFNDLLCYFTFIGCWKEMEPLQVVGMKRIIDKKIYLAAPLFSEEWFDKCMQFQLLCFETYSGWGKDALIKTKYQRRKDAFGKKWKSEWETYFSLQISDPNDIKNIYSEIMKTFAQDIGVNTRNAVPSSGRVPANIK